MKYFEVSGVDTSFAFNSNKTGQIIVDIVKKPSIIFYGMLYSVSV